ncbi:MAG: DEAD/DEAH box helicase family protein [Akkermansiaceae bacterium]|nr:DEAD/DEAH box helicase family protein [Akkermansiaceae bacterium]
MSFNEDARVKIPAILHLTRLGYAYLSLKDATWDPATNIFPALFRASVAAINPGASADDIDRLLQEISLLLENEDLGKAFHERLTRTSGLRLIDFENFDRNSFHVVTELTCQNGDDEFRPDITLLINGMPLIFTEVKKPNNRDGILAERNRINARFRNPKFRRFVNLTQLMVFSNNMEYENNSPEPLEGAFYASPSYEEPVFNYFREEETRDLSQLLAPEDPATEDLVLADNNLASIKHSPEFATNKSPLTPTNRLSTALFSRDRLAFLLRFAFAYVRTETGYEKHVMRYPQIFATMAIARCLAAGTRKGIIWHTQGSGKTALAFYNVHYLTAWFQRQGIVPKFYFIVDRIDLLQQASREFRSRGLIVHTINSRHAFARDIKSASAIHNDSGQPEITVVNIQKFQDDPDVVRASDYNISLQRVYFLDEVHRSYNPQGSFLANLNESDTRAIKLGLTGTPLIGDHKSKALFGNYIHKYYYNASIADGYTLRLIREEIETKYKLELAKTLEEIEVLKGRNHRTLLYAHEKFVAPMLDYIVADFEKARLTHNDPGIGAMVICDSADQAKKMADLFVSKYASVPPPMPEAATDDRLLAADDIVPFRFTPKPDRSVKSHALILHDVGTKDERKQWVEDFKAGKIDLLFVYNMLLTGFDSRRLKKLYLGRVIKAHNLLQALTRVNRTYKRFRYGYVVDFADIQTEFDKTNKAYFDELQAELGDELEHYSDLFKSPDEITAEIDAIKDALFHFDTTNAEIFSQQITAIRDRTQMRAVLKALTDARNLYNLIRSSGQYDLLAQLDFRALAPPPTEAENHLALLNQREALENAHDNTNLLNIALEDVLFTFRKVAEAEMVIADELKDTLRRTREGLASNFDPRDPEFITLREELERLFRKKNLSEITQADMVANIAALNDIHARARELERRNQLLRAKYANDAKYARLHKRLLEKGEPTPNERKLFEALSALKIQADARISQNAQLLTNPAYTEAMMLGLIVEQFAKLHHLPLTPESTRFINALVMKEYLDEFNGQHPA